MNFNDLWISSIERELEKENFKEAIRLAKEGLGWSKNDLIKACKVDKWKKELDKIYLTDKPMG
tara:strand:- start:175 stop:363 length:189 start_codon:yes stop_codon:yes gene_type:complete